MFIWCGFHIAAMAWIARKRLERQICPGPVFSSRQSASVSRGVVAKFLF
jgi:hypothetical protein